MSTCIGRIIDHHRINVSRPLQPRLPVLRRGSLSRSLAQLPSSAQPQLRMQQMRRIKEESKQVLETFLANRSRSMPSNPAETRLASLSLRSSPVLLLLPAMDRPSSMVLMQCLQAMPVNLQPPVRTYPEIIVRRRC